MDIKSQILATPKTFAGYGHAVWLRPAKFLALYEFIFEEKPCYTDLLIDMAVHLTNARVFLELENKTLSKSRVFSLGENLKNWGHMAAVYLRNTHRHTGPGYGHMDTFKSVPKCLTSGGNRVEIPF